MLAALRSRSLTPRNEYLTYSASVQAGAVGDMDFTLQDFRDYIERLRKSDLRGDETYKKRMPCNGVTADDYHPNAIG